MAVVKGVDQFKAHFSGQEESYALIGGAACDLLFGEAGLPFRATKDFDMVLCVEIVDKAFAEVFSGFLNAGGYQARERSSGQREFYRFHKPSDKSFPSMIELFSRQPDGFELPDDAQLTPIAVEESAISLSAILLDDDYYAALQDKRRIINGISLADESILIPFKARAYLDLLARKTNGEEIDNKQIKKHRADVFRLAQLLPAEIELDLPEPLNADMSAFLASVTSDEDFDYSALKLPLSYDKALAVLSNAYPLEPDDNTSSD